MEIKKIAKMLLLATVMGMSSQAAFSQETNQYQNYSRRVENVMSNSSDYARLKLGGVLKGILYEPTEVDLLNIASNLYGEVSKKNSQFLVNTSLERIVSNSVANFYQTYSNSQDNVKIFPTISKGNFRTGLPRYIIFPKNFPNLFENNNDFDLQNVCEHELAHVQDAYYGIISDANFPQGSITNTEIFVNLLEFRANYKILKKMLIDKTRGTLNNSHAFLEKTANMYIAQIKNLDSLYPCASDYEKKVLEYEINKCSDIQIMQNQTGKLGIHFKENTTSLNQ